MEKDAIVGSFRVRKSDKGFNVTIVNRALSSLHEGSFYITLTYIPFNRNVMYENRMLGVPRIRQLRTANNSCPILPDFSKAIKRCHAPYSMAYEDTSGLVFLTEKIDR